jgi:two-component system sensor histidine kinase PilS (NtrC family)
VFIYARRAGSIEGRPAWVIGTRLVTVGVTVAMAWPWREQAAGLSIALTVYAVVSAAAVLLILAERRYRLPILTGAFMAAQIICELAVISGIVYFSGGIFSPSISLYLMTIISAALFYRLAGTLVVATLASASFLTAVWVGAGHQAASLWSTDALGALGQLSDEEFFSVFLRLCIFYLCAFAGGYLAERLDSKDAALAHTSEALKIAKLETGDILKHLHSGVLTIDVTGRVVYFNRAAEEILGLSERTVRGRTLAAAFGTHLPPLAERLEAVLRSRKMDIRTELNLPRPDGRTIPIGLSTSVLRGAGGSPRGVIAVFQDLTEAKELEERVRSQDRLAAVGELSAGIAHEIRNPLAAISGSVEVLGRELNLEGENQRLMALIMRESARLNKILSDFLMYARMLPTVSGRVGVAEVADEVLELTRRQLSAESSLAPALELEIPDRSVHVKADADHLKQILFNLVLNAVEACQSVPETTGGTVTIRVTTPVRDDIVTLAGESQANPDDWVAIMVDDTGCGIPASVRERLFEPFVSSKSTGTGLGLAIARRLVDNAGGYITAESREGSGMSFAVYLRRAAAEPRSNDSAVAAGQKHRVLQPSVASG